MRFAPLLLLITGSACIKSALSADFWALIVVGSKGWDNYRHQADACHAYHVMLNKGVPATNIILMMYDDIASNKMNETPGKIFNRPNGTDVYEGVSIDYRGKNVSAQNFIQVLTGNTTSMKGIGTGKVINSSQESTIFINLIGHGGQGLMLFPENELKASELQSALANMSDNKQFGKIVFYVESCDSGSLFDGVIPNNNSIIAVTAAPQNENSYAWYCINYVKGTYLCLGDEFSVTWMEYMDQTVDFEKVFTHYEYVRNKVTRSHVSIYGDLTVGANVFSPSRQATNYEKLDGFESVDNRDMALFLASNRINQVQNNATGSNYTALIKKRAIADRIIMELVKMTVSGDETRANDIRKFRSTLNSTITGCYDYLVDGFREKCFKWTEHPYFLKHLKQFVNICAMGLDTSAMLASMTEICSKENIKGTIV